MYNILFLSETDCTTVTKYQPHGINTPKTMKKPMAVHYSPDDGCM
jgi:hypothetical protein